MQFGTSFSSAAHGSHSESDASSTPELSVFSGSLLCVASSEASEESCEDTGLLEAFDESCEERESSDREEKKASKELSARLGME